MFWEKKILRLEAGDLTGENGRDLGLFAARWY